MDKRAEAISHLEDYLAHLDSERMVTLAALEGYGAKPKAPGEQKRGSSGVPFASKYSEPAKVLVLREFEDAKPRGLTLKELQGRLKAKELVFTDQNSRDTVKRLETAGKLKREKCSRGPARYQWRAV